MTGTSKTDAVSHGEHQGAVQQTGVAVPGAESVTGQVRGVYGLPGGNIRAAFHPGDQGAGMAKYRTGVRPGGVRMGGWTQRDAASTAAARETARAAGGYLRGVCARGRRVGCA